MKVKKNKIIVGWREWVSLPDFGIPAIKAKVDTGAKTSAIHAFDIEPYTSKGIKKIRFKVNPFQKDNSFVTCKAELVGRRYVTDSGGHKENRYVISTHLSLADESWPIEITLTDRGTMQFRMLLGRGAMHGRIIVDPGRSYITGPHELKTR